MGSASASSSGSGSKDDGEEWVLSHADVVLIRSDLAILRGPRFINDRIIAFYFAHLSAGLQGSDSDDLLLLPPSIPYLLSNLRDRASVAAVAAPLRLASRRLVLLPVNDNADASVAEGGSHWSLLVLDSATTTTTSSSSPSAGPRFVHHDSVRGAPNFPIAAHLADALRPLLQARCDSGPGGAVPVLPLVHGFTPRQTNCYDCGVYVMAIARTICAWWKRSDAQDRRGRDWFEAVWTQVDASSVKAMRTDLLQLINTLIQEKEKAKSSSKSKSNSTSEGDTDQGSSTHQNE